MNLIKLNSVNGKQTVRTYSKLPRWGTLELSCNLKELSRALKTVETAGFFGLTIKFINNRSALICARKGKDGPCYDTGRTAFYLGSALAVIDDDNHFIYKSIRVCEKTGSVYGSETYKGHLRVTPADKKLLKTLETDPVPFNCDTFEKDALLLSDMVKYSSEKPEAPILYPGPFKKIILKNGTIIRRGEISLVSAKTARSLAKTEKSITLRPGNLFAEPVMPSNFQKEYKKSGPLFILDKTPAAAPKAASKTSEFERLNNLPDELRNKLQSVIKHKIPYFVITGSDPRIAGGCCPSIEVYFANKLANAGILTSWMPPLSKDACTMTVYAFKGEMRDIKTGEPKFKINSPFRAKVLEHLARQR